MPIFSRRDSAAPPGSSATGSPEASPSPSPASAQRRRVTHIAPGTRVQGQLLGPTELLIEGEVQGEIQVEASVMVGSDGVVQGPIRAQVVRVSGRVAGDVQASERVEVAPSGSVEGDITAPRVVIAEGAFFKGRVEMTGERAEKERDLERERMREKEREQRSPRETGHEPRRAKGGEAGTSQKATVETGG